MASDTVCVTGASGFVGSWLVMRLLQRGYSVRATVRDPSQSPAFFFHFYLFEQAKKVKFLLELPGANTRLTLWKADLSVEGSFDDAINGCDGVFHVATPMDFESKDPENEVIMPAIRGMLDIMKACEKAKVRRLVFTSSAGTVDVEEHPKTLYDETCWTDTQFCRTVKMTGWMYFVSKTVAEQEAWKYAKEHNIDFISVIPPLVVGPFLIPTMPPSLITALSPITGNEAHYSIIKQSQLVSLDDLCLAHIFLYEKPEAEGRYICCSDVATIHDIAKMLNRKYPHYNVPTTFKGIADELETITLSSEKIKKLGFQFKYNLEDMYSGAIESCIEKGLVPKAAVVESGELVPKPAVSGAALI
ncbi:dihydroflavonol 4-reducatase 2 [Senna tora]|uniref:Flavanone 4-reductase n=1 Tax=Senna tora TaxID=362788 RepID=A0A834TW39_9FABA|nr:dihydroflavonol 4-reducatase 2 [Senna tora]